MRDVDLMRRCLELAAKAQSIKRAAVGSLIVSGGTVISEGFEGSSELPGVLAHAELIAIVKAIEARNSRDLSDCTLYTTVEPCFMCSFVIRETRIKEVVYGAEAASVGGATSRYSILTAEDIARWHVSPGIKAGVLLDECSRMLSARQL